jgi:hypothetical protein
MRTRRSRSREAAAVDGWCRKMWVVYAACMMIYLALGERFVLGYLGNLSSQIIELLKH